jgi:transcriptional regulator
MVRTTIPKELIGDVKKLRKKGLSYEKISLKLSISKHKIMYLLNEDYRENIKKRRNENYQRNKLKIKKNITIEKKEKIKKYQRDYHKKKYDSDPEFRKKQIQRVLKSKGGKSH